MIDGKRRGIFNISEEMILQDFEKVYKMFSKLEFIIYEVKFDYNWMLFKYLGSSPKFAELYEGWETPIYKFEDFEGEE